MLIALCLEMCNFFFENFNFILQVYNFKEI